ncbi:MAG TPA: sugar kinase [Streptosporangiaceae bacterium]|jgi:2-dehydro-3-deoxygluconokinase
MSEYDVVTAGEAMVLLTPEPLGPLRTTARAGFSVAGAEATVARYLALLGHRTAWVSAVGADPFGQRVLDEVAGSGVDTSLVRTDPAAPTGVFFKDPQPGGGTSVYYYRAASAASFLSVAALAGISARPPRLMHVSGVTAALSGSCRELVRGLLARRPGGRPLTSFDLNYRPRLWARDDPAAVLLSLAGAADLVFAGLDEARQLWGTRTAEEVRAVLPGPGQLVVKDAAVGATLFTGEGPPVFEPSVPVAVVEVIGAGDAFAAGYLHGWLLGLGGDARLRLGHLLAGASLRVASDIGPLPDGFPRAPAPGY